MVNTAEVVKRNIKEFVASRIPVEEARDEEDRTIPSIKVG